MFEISGRAPQAGLETLAGLIRYTGRTLETHVTEHSLRTFPMKRTCFTPSSMSLSVKHPLPKNDIPEFFRDSVTQCDTDRSFNDVKASMITQSLSQWYCAANLCHAADKRSAACPEVTTGRCWQQTSVIQSSQA